MIMLKQLAILFIMVLGAAVGMSTLLLSIATAQDKDDADVGMPWLPTREIHIPLHELPILLGGKNERTFMTRSEYEALLKKAKANSALLATEHQAALLLSKIPQYAIMTEAQHRIEMQSGRALIQSDISIDILKPGLHSVHLPLEHVGLLEATVDDQPALLSPSLDANRPGATLFLKDQGRYQLRLKMGAAVSSAAAVQALKITLPQAAANKWTMQVPGNIEILSGAHVRSRRVDAASNSTHLEWLPNLVDGDKLSCPIHLVMTLNNKMLRESNAFEARSFLLSQISQSYEQLTQRVEITVHNGSVSKLRIAFPDGFEVRSVACPLLSKWQVSRKGDADEADAADRVDRVGHAASQWLELELREPATDQVLVDIVASKPARSDYSEVPVVWTWPNCVVLDAVSQTAILSLSLERGLQMDVNHFGHLIPIDPSAVEQAISASLRNAEPTASQFRSVISLYAPDSNQDVSGAITKPKAIPKISTNIAMTISNAGARAHSILDVETGSESVDHLDLNLPAEWRLQSVKRSDGTALPFEILQREQESPRTRVRMARPLAASSAHQISLEFGAVPNGWLGDWSERTIRFPKIEIDESETLQSVLSVIAQDDFAIEVAEGKDLLTLFENERVLLRVQGDGSGPSFLAQNPDWSLELLAKRKTTQLTAEVFSFFKIESDGIQSVYELHLDAKQASQDSFSFSLPSTTPQEITIRGLNGVSVKESTSKMEGNDRVWAVKLASRQVGLLRLRIEFSQSLPTGVDLAMSNPSIKNTIYQTGVIALEGDDELEIAIVKHPRTADVGELTESEYAIGNRLLGVYEYSATGQSREVVIRAEPRGLLAVPTTIVERAELHTALSDQGVSYHVAELHLKTNGGFLQASLPSNATLWSVLVDGSPSLPQRSGDQLLIELQSSSRLPRSHEDHARLLRIAYQTPIPTIAMRGAVDLVAPTLATMETATSSALAIPIVDMDWQIWVPDALNVMGCQGDLTLSRASSDSGFPFNILHIFGLAHPATRNVFLNIRDSQPEPAVLPQSQSNMPFSSQAVPTPNTASLGIPSQQALDGLRTLLIEFEPPKAWRAVTLAGFGDNPRVRLSITNQSKLRWIAIAIGALTAAFGIATRSHSLLRATRWATIVMALAVGGSLLSPWPEETGLLASGPFYAALIVLTLTVFNAASRPVRDRLQWSSKKWSVGLPALLLLSIWNLNHPAFSQESPPPRDLPTSRQWDTLDSWIAAFKVHANGGVAPLEIPADAILIPYSPESAMLNGGEQKILVPHSTTMRLLKMVDPRGSEKKPTEPPVDYSVSGLVATTTLDREDALTLSLSLNIVPHTTRSILVPFALEGAALVSADLDGHPASLRSGPQGFALLVEGTRHQKFNAAFQIPIKRLGGWQIVQAKIPSAPSARLQLNVPSASTELRMIGLPDAEQRLTTRDNEEIQTSLLADGSLSFQWRRKVFERVVDQGLSVDSDCSLKVEEQGIHLAWNVRLDFRGGNRDRFEFELPTGLDVEKVSGKNIRGWSIESRDERQVLKVSLLKSANDSEQLAIFARLPQRMGAGQNQLVPIPRLIVPDAMVQRGRFSIVRSATLDIEIATADGLVREDLSKDSLLVATHSPIPLQPFQAYRYASKDYQLSLKISDQMRLLSSRLETTLRVSRNESQLQSRIRLSTGDRPLFRTSFEVDADWEWSMPTADAPFEWTLSKPQNGKRTLDMLFRNGQHGTVVIGFVAKQVRQSDAPSNEYSIELPKIITLNATSEKGELAVFADAGVDVRPEGLVGCSVVGAHRDTRGTESMGAIHLDVPRAAISLDAADYQGTLRFQPRKPIVTAMSISNVKVTRRSLEETVFIEWEIKEAGVHRLEFLMPNQLKDAVVLGPMIRNVLRTPSSEQIDAPWKIAIELQEEVIGQYRVLVQKDSPLPSQVHSVPIPVILTGLVEHRFVTLENSGRDEILIDSLKGVTPLVRGDSQWIHLKALLGSDSADVYRVSEQSTSTELGSIPVSDAAMTIQAQSRSLVESSTARIGLAQCVVSVDEASNYRATQEFRVENGSESFLELEMPSGSELWTASVAGASVKPIQSPNQARKAGAKRLRLPLIRTQAGDLDYAVELKYAGKLSKQGFTTKWDFPLVQSININVELSQVKLLLPQNQYWYGFNGTLGRVQDESSFLAGWLLHKNKQIDRLSQLSSRDSELFSKIRAEGNLAQLESDVKLQLGNSKFDANGNSELRQQIAENDFAVNRAKTQNAKNSAQTQPTAPNSADNRQSLNILLGSQFNYRSGGNLPNNPNGSGANTASQPQQVPTANPPIQNSLGIQGFQNRESQIPGEEQSKDSRGLAERYKSKLQMSNAMQSVAPPAGAPTGPSNGLMNGAFNELPVLELATNGQKPSETYLSSLSITLPTRGNEYFFSTPRGEAELSAHGISKSIAWRSLGAVLLVFVMFVLRGGLFSYKPKLSQ